MAGYMAQRAVRKMRSPSCDCQHHHRSRAEWSGLFFCVPWSSLCGSEDTMKKELKRHDRLSDQNHFSLLPSSHHLHVSCQSHHLHDHLNHHPCHLDLWNPPPVHQLQHLRLLHLLHRLPQRLRQPKKSSESSSSCCTEKSRCSSTGHRLRPLSGDLRVLKRSCVKHIVHPDFQIRWRPGAQREALPCRWFAASGELQAHRKSRHDNTRDTSSKWKWSEVAMTWRDNSASSRNFVKEVFTAATQPNHWEEVLRLIV